MALPNLNDIDLTKVHLEANPQEHYKAYNIRYGDKALSFTTGERSVRIVESTYNDQTSISVMVRFNEDDGKRQASKLDQIHKVICKKAYAFKDDFEEEVKSQQDMNRFIGSPFYRKQPNKQHEGEVSFFKTWSAGFKGASKFIRYDPSSEKTLQQVDPKTLVGKNLRAIVHASAGRITNSDKTRLCPYVIRLIIMEEEEDNQEAILEEIEEIRFNKELNKDCL